MNLHTETSLEREKLIHMRTVHIEEKFNNRVRLNYQHLKNPNLYDPSLSKSPACNTLLFENAIDYKLHMQ
jgi:hypothetical protein